jgi:hypothetical protein
MPGIREGGVDVQPAPDAPKLANALSCAAVVAIPPGVQYLTDGERTGLPGHEREYQLINRWIPHVRDYDFGV